MLDQTPDAQSPYRTSNVLSLTVELENQKRELDRLRTWKKRSRIGVVIALAVATVHVAAFSGVLLLRYVPKLPPPEPAAVPIACATVTDPTPAPPPTSQAVTPIVEAPSEPSALDQVGGDDAVPKLAAEITQALYADPVLARSPRMYVYGRAKMEVVVRQQLQTLLGATADAVPLDPFEIAWDLRPTEEEWTAMSAVVDKALEKHGVSDANRSSIMDTISGNESTATDDIPKRRAALHLRAAVALGCTEGAMTLRALELTDTRVVTGCGKSAIYNYTADPNTGVSAWHRETAP